MRYSKYIFILFELDLCEWLFLNSPSKERKKNTKASMEQWKALG